MATTINWEQIARSQAERLQKNEQAFEKIEFMLKGLVGHTEDEYLAEKLRKVIRYAQDNQSSL
jgi:hypothetical protein